MTQPVVVPPVPAAPAPTQGAPQAAEGQGIPVPAKETPKIETPPTPSKLEAAQRAIAKAKADAAKNQQFTQSQAQQKAALDSQKAEIERLKAENTNFQSWRESLVKNPYDALKQMGMTDQQLTQAALSNNSAEKLLAKLHNELAEEKAARKAFEDSINQEKATATRTSLEKQMVSECSNEELYPYLSQQPPDALLALTYAHVNKLRNTIHPDTGRPIDLDAITLPELAGALELLYDSHVKTRKSHKSQTDTNTNTTQEDNSAPAKKPVANKTLTNSTSQKKWTLPANWDSLPDREQVRIMAEQVRQSQRGR